MPLDIPHKLWLPPKPAIIRPASQERLLHDRVSQELLATFPFPVFAPGSSIVAAAWDPAHKSANITLSGSNYIATWSGIDGSALISTAGKATGKWYAEVVSTVNSGHFGLGFATSSFSTSKYMTNGDTHVWGIDHFGNYWAAGIEGAPSPFGSITNGQVVQIALDGGGGKAWIGVNNTFDGSPSAGTGAFVTGLSGTFFIYGSQDSGSSSSVLTINSTQTYAPPSGFSTWG